MIEVTDTLERWRGFGSFKRSAHLKRLLTLDADIIGVFAGNQGGKTANAAFSYIMRILGIHPIERKNRLAKQIRCLSSSLPESSDANEQDNTQYLELKRMLPPELIVKDITARSKTLVVASPTHGKSYFEFMSTKQELQDTGKVQRCVAEGQRVLMADGVWREIEKIKPGDEVVCEAVGGFGDRQRTNFVEDAWCNGERGCLRIRCQKGIEFVVTSDHKVMVPGPGRSKYVEAGALKVGDSIVCRTNKIGRVDDSFWQARVKGEVPLFQVILTAVLLGDGTITEKQTQPKFTCKNQALVSAIKGLLPDDIYLREQVFSNGHAPDYFIGDRSQGGNRVKDFLKEHNVWGCTAGNKFIPDVIFRQPEFAVRQFLRFIFGCDGWATGHSIGYCSTSERLTQDIFLLLRRLEIRSNINKKVGKNGWADQFWINICQSSDVIRFCDLVGIAGKSDAVKKVRAEAERRVGARVSKCRFGSSAKVGKRVPQRVKIKSITDAGVRRVYDISMRAGGWDTQQRNGISVQRKTARTKRNNFVVQGGVVLHNCSLWEDEEPPKPFREESRRRLLTRGGDEIITLTPINGLSYLYDDVWNKRGYVWRSDAIVEALRMPKEEYNPNGDKNIACIQIATDDNPIMTKEMVDLNFASEDPDEIMVRRYGVFKQIAGRVHKSFDESVHVIDYNKYFPNGIPYSWTHARGIDYHESRTPWSIGWLSVSPENEWFVWQEFHPAIDGPHSMNTWEIAKSIVRKSMDYYYIANLIDPLANKKQPNTLFSVTDDLNRHFESLRVDHGMGTPTMWQGWDTKATTGYNEIKARMKNSLQVKKPFSNTYRDKGETKNLPTIWFCNCPNFVRSIKLWSYEEWATPVSRAVNDPKSKRQEKYSHDNMVLEAWGKDPRLRGYKWSFNATLHGVYSRTGRPVRSANHGVH